MAFLGKNKTTSAAKLAFERSKYSLKAFPENQGMGQPPIVNFNFAERNLYGKVDRLHNPVIPNEDYLRPIYLSRNNENVVRVMNFVADQFNGFQEHYIRACRMRLIDDDDPVLSMIKAYRGYEDPMVKYDAYVDNIMSTYVYNFLPNMLHRVVNFNDFLRIFPEFMERMDSTFPVTLSGFQRSIQSSIFTSGLAIDIGNIKFGDDEVKQDTFLNNNSFQYYVNMAKQYGLSVNKQNPGVLVSDLRGPGCIPYRSNYQLAIVDDVFSKQYIKTIYRDMQQLRFYLVEFYNTFVTLYPEHREIYTCQYKTHSKLTERQYVNNINNNMNNKILYLYIIIRNIEEDKPYTLKQLEAYYENALRLKDLSEDRMVDYLEDMFQKKYVTKSGSLTSQMKKKGKKLDN